MSLVNEMLRDLDQRRQPIDELSVDVELSPAQEGPESWVSRLVVPVAGFCFVLALLALTVAYAARARTDNTPTINPLDNASSLIAHPASSQGSTVWGGQASSLTDSSASASFP